MASTAEGASEGDTDEDELLLLTLSFPLVRLRATIAPAITRAENTAKTTGMTISGRNPCDFPSPDVLLLLLFLEVTVLDGVLTGLTVAVVSLESVVGTDWDGALVALVGTETGAEVFPIGRAVTLRSTEDALGAMVE